MFNQVTKKMSPGSSANFEQAYEFRYNINEKLKPFYSLKHRTLARHELTPSP